MQWVPFPWSSRCTMPRWRRLRCEEVSSACSSWLSPSVRSRLPSTMTSARRLIEFAHLFRHHGFLLDRLWCARSDPVRSCRACPIHDSVSFSGTNHIGGTGDTQTQAAWRIPLALQLFPALILGLGALFIPFSPRWLVKQGREEEALAVLSRARPHAPPDLVRLEFLCVDRFSVIPPEDMMLIECDIVSGRSRHSTSSRRRCRGRCSRSIKTERSRPTLSSGSMSI